MVPFRVVQSSIYKSCCVILAVAAIAGASMLLEQIYVSMYKI